MGFDPGPVWIEALLEDVTGKMLFALERAIGKRVGDMALTGDMGRSGGFFKMPDLPWVVRLQKRRYMSF